MRDGALHRGDGASGRQLERQTPLGKSGRQNSFYADEISIFVDRGYLARRGEPGRSIRLDGPGRECADVLERIGALTASSTQNANQQQSSNTPPLILFH